MEDFWLRPIKYINEENIPWMVKKQISIVYVINLSIGKTKMIE